MFSTFAPDHKCHNSGNGCKKKVHNLCCQASDLHVEEDGLIFFALGGANNRDKLKN